MIIRDGYRRAWLGTLWAWFAVTSCHDRSASGSGASASAAASAPAASGLPQAAASDAPACPKDMLLVDGAYCPEVEQRCLETHPEDVEHEEANQRCGSYASPSVCLSSTRELLRFCIDRYEWPNRAGEKPRVLTRWTDANELCASVGKRLCADREWTFACEGEQMLPYTYGFKRDPTRCVLDRLYVTPPAGALTHWDECQRKPECLKALAHVDQREPSGSFKDCVSPFGVFDMNGNANEWVTVADGVYPHRGGLKGGWWGPVRDRCRPTVHFHREDDWGYETGLRCCKDSSP
ncbi:MAG TPA: SUMF1/EgtB/PvdO family nonheme iron enzyme [Polyangiaceae bacterium]|nr:SUMF1/EgtB/PvdO family nonheme iron enzyme [Polyangiaceae bacterium]